MSCDLALSSICHTLSSKNIKQFFSFIHVLRSNSAVASRLQTEIGAIQDKTLEN